MPGAWWMFGDREVGDDAEVVAGPRVVDGCVEGKPAIDDIQRRPVRSATHHDIVDSASKLQRHLASPYQGIRRGEGVARLVRVHCLPGVAVRHAGLPQRLL